jgi:hypothetical protein
MKNRECRIGSYDWRVARELYQRKGMKFGVLVVGCGICSPRRAMSAGRILVRAMYQYRVLFHVMAI